MRRAPRPDDLYALRVPSDLRLSPDGRWICFSVKAAAPGKDGHREALWLVPSDGSAPPRQLTLGAKTDTSPRWSPDGRTIAFLSDRGSVLKAGGGGDRHPSDERKEADTQVWLLPLDGGEARQLTRLPKDVEEIAWSPDGRRLCVVSGAQAAEEREHRRREGEPPEPDLRLIDRLEYQLNGKGFVHDRVPNLWIVDPASGETRRLTRGRSRDEQPTWSPDGTRIAFVSDRHPDADLTWRSDVYLVDAEGGEPVRVTGGRGERAFYGPAWSPDGAWLAILGHRFPAGAGSRSDVWRFRPVAEDDGEDLTAESDLMVASTMNSDLFGAASDPRPSWTPDGRSIVFAAPIDGSYELWRVEVASRSVERLTQDRHYLSRVDLAPAGDGAAVVGAVRASGHEPPDLVSFELRTGDGAGPASPPRRLTDLMGDAWAEIEWVRPQERWHEVDGRRIQGWFLPAPARGDSAAPLVVEIHGGPQTLYGWSPFWEWQCLVALGMSVYACNPRGSEGYGQDFAAANHRDWGDGPMRDIIAGVDSLVADGQADPGRLGVTGGSYGGYLTTWIVGHSDRFRAAVTARSVSDMTSQMLSGDIGGPTFGRYEFGVNPWEDPELYRAQSPLTYAERIHTPLLIQHAEKDLRCPITQGEELFAVLRSLRRPVRFMRVPYETLDRTLSGTPCRRVENLDRITAWFRHFVVDGATRVPPLEPPGRPRRRRGGQAS